MTSSELQSFCERITAQFPTEMSGEEIALMLAYFAYGYSSTKGEGQRHLTLALLRFTEIADQVFMEEPRDAET